ncbi:hemerythrin domain-containing protein [Actinomadura sp. BRA 177]|uniref:hemerythrin domain-containing protein n=1 Tax=Actinomadura sp. BRA 177 TaxID=2745202 RepID=UPI0015952102|nr:hemerythrin domain-containing protein [Actinomadura sp. BRA 177]NVI92206.1 hemerythrin domain-containing protein [Actinomadura sp. BRA 177]
MADVFEVLGRDHTEVKRMLAELEAGSSRAVPDREDRLRLRKKMVEELIIEESKHEAVEEEYFWPAVRRLVPDGELLADEAVGQEQAAKHVLNDLLGKDPTDGGFEELLTRFTADGREHIEFEEVQVWPKLRVVITADEAEELGRKLEQGKKTAPTRPHPHTPPKPGVLRSAGPAVAAADRLRDRMTGRGQE